MCQNVFVDILIRCFWVCVRISEFRILIFQLLTEFKFTPGPTAKSILGYSNAFNRVTGTLKARNFDPAQIKFPKGSSHFWLHYGVLEYDLKKNVFRFLPAIAPLEVAKGEAARELVLEVPEKPKRGRLVFWVMKTRFFSKSGDRKYPSYAKGGVGIGIVHCY